MTKIFAGVGIYTEEFFKLKNLTRHKIGLKKQEIKFLKEVSVLTWRDHSRVKMAKNFVFSCHFITKNWVNSKVTAEKVLSSKIFSSFHFSLQLGMSAFVFIEN